MSRSLDWNIFLSVPLITGHILAIGMKGVMSPRFQLLRAKHSLGPSAQKQETMNAFKAYKACVPIAWSPNLYITLVRAFLEPGDFTGVKRLVVIETEEMYKARKEKEASHRLYVPFGCGPLSNQCN
ncbi:unnamed protein product [Thlaspi arvense]|uniref:Uncharacterized protein n=1 Tax=Thlaspi arvense TaxID=13288 RepID=A0AAU9RS43_THLAR|nr:unnamed protein product [Thlaspi arvense]